MADRIQQLKILFVSRAYPPLVGGLESQNYQLSKWLSQVAEVETIANLRGKKALPWFIPFGVVKTLVLLRHYDALLLGDGVLAVLGWLVRQVYPKKPIICILHGLDITYSNSVYQRLWVRVFLRRLDHCIAVSNSTQQEAIARGVSRDRLTVINNGIEAPNEVPAPDRQQLERLLGEPLKDRLILLTIGRVVKRKGVAWFVVSVVPKLDENIIYLVAGSGPEYNTLENVVTERELEGRVKLMGEIDEQTKRLLLSTAGVFIQPNIKVNGDMEGFGLSALEAASFQLPVIASRLEGLKDAIVDGKNGYLVDSENVVAFIEKITTLLSKPEARLEFGLKARQYVLEHSRWEVVIQAYKEVISNCIQTLATKRILSLKSGARHSKL